jgi:hypothetical protein
MGIGSPFFTRRTEAYTQNVLQLMRRQGAYNAEIGRGFPAPPAAGAPVVYRDYTFAVKPR